LPCACCSSTPTSPTASRTLIEAEAQRSASPGTEIEVLTAPFGVAYIETRFEALIGAYATAQLAASTTRARRGGGRGLRRPGLDGLREVLPVPVTGLTEAALASAHLLGTASPIIAISQRIQAWYREVVESYGFGRLASIRALDRPLARHRRRAGGPCAGAAGAVPNARSRRRRRSDHRAGRRAARPPAWRGALHGQLPVPVVDGVSSAVRHAETPATRRWPVRCASCRR
jgi:allantoin racemase